MQTWAKLIFPVTTLVICVALPALAQEPARLTSPALQFTGPAGQMLLVTTRYYDAGQSKTVSDRLNIGDLQSLPLEPGHDALRVYVTVPTAQPVQIRLLENGIVVRRLDSHRPGVLELTVGNIDPKENFHPPRALLDSRERELTLQLLNALENASTRDIVSELPRAKLEWQMLDAYCRTLHTELGSFTQLSTGSADAEPMPPTLDGWLSWESRGGARVISGPAEFERGTCHLTLETFNGKVLDLTVDADQMPEAWYDGPKATSQPRDESSELASVIERSENLSRKMFTDDVAAARQLFSPKFREDIAVESLQQLSSTLREIFGTDIRSVEYRDWQLGPYDSDSHSKRLSIRLAIDFASHKQAAATVVFVIPCGKNVIGRTELAAIDVRETLQSFAPNELQAIDKLLNLMLGGDSSDTAADQFVGLLHPQAQACFDRERLPPLIARISRELGKPAEPPNWWQWQYQTTGSNLAASGTVNCENGSVDLQFDFAAGRLLGVTLLGTRLALSTLDLVDGVQPTGELGRDFWQELLERDFPAAHALLSPKFQLQLPLAPFEKSLIDSDLGQLPEMTEIRLETLRLSNRIDRSVPVALTAIYIARLADGSQVALQCEFQREQDKFALISFTDQLQCTIPVDDQAPCSRVLTAFLSNDVEQVLQLMADDEQKEVATPILTAFLNKLNGALGNTAVDEPIAPQLLSSRLVHDYSGGTRIERMAATAQIGSHEVPFEATLQFGQLKSFYFGEPALKSFAGELENVACIETQGLEFIQQWMNPQQTQSTLAYLTPELRTDAVLRQLVRQRDEITQVHGELSLANLVEWSPRQDSNEVQTLFEMQLEQRSVQVELVFALSAIDAKINTLKVVPVP